MFMNNLIGSVMMMVATAALVPGCGLQSCTDVGCGPALSVEFVGGQWEAGEYEITVVADGVTTTCTATLPLTSCESAVSCDRPDRGFWVMHSGCALEPAEQRLDGLEWTGEGPAQVSVEVRRDGALLSTESVAPSYRTSYPNGEECGPACQHADQTLTVAL